MNPAKGLVPDTVVVELGSKTLMSHFIKSFAEIFQNGVDLLPIVQSFVQVVNCCNEMGLTGSSLSKPCCWSQ